MRYRFCMIPPKAMVAKNNNIIHAMVRPRICKIPCTPPCEDGRGGGVKVVGAADGDTDGLVVGA